MVAGSLKALDRGLVEASYFRGQSRKRRQRRSDLRIGRKPRPTRVSAIGGAWLELESGWSRCKQLWETVKNPELMEARASACSGF